MLPLNQAIATICQSPDWDETRIVRELVARGMPRSQAEKVTALVPLAFGRVLMKSLPIRFPSEAIVHDPQTGTNALVRLDDEPLFAEARSAAEAAYSHGVMTRDQFAAVALRSPEVAAVNQALQAGARPEDLECLPPELTWSSDAAQT